jgi:uncharacterized membrane protein YphA (DoxX/SURF4 family)
MSATIAVNAGRIDRTVRRARTGSSAPSRAASAALWSLQILLAALFLFAGVMKLVMPLAALTQQAPLPGVFLRFIGVVETVGALGLILPWLLRIRPLLTPIAAGGLVIIMSGAIGATLAIGGGLSALFPGAVGCLLGTVAYFRWHQAAERSRTAR